MPRAPVRGTQSFVNTMSGVWRRPALTGREVLWRWAATTPLLALVAWQGSRLWPSLAIDTAAILGMTVFRPVEAFETIQTTISALAPVLLPTAAWLLPLCFLVWTLASAVGRSSVLRRLDPALHPTFGVTLGLRTLRNAVLVLLLSLWWAASRAAAALTISRPCQPWA